MSSTMLQLVQQTTAELNLAVPNVVVGSQSQDVNQILALMNRAGYDLLKEYDWRALEKEYRFYTQAISTTGTVTNGSYIITGIPSTTGIVADKWMVTGTGIPQDCYVIVGGTYSWL